MSYIPDPDELVNGETRAAFSGIVDGIRNAETDRELLVYMERFHKAANELRAIFTIVESEFMRTLRKLRDDDEAGGFEQVMGELHQVRERADAREEELKK